MLVKNVEQIFSFVLEMMGTCIYFRVQLPALFLLFWRIVFIFLLLLAFFYFFFIVPYTLLWLIMRFACAKRQNRVMVFEVLVVAFCKSRIGFQFFQQAIIWGWK